MFFLFHTYFIYFIPHLLRHNLTGTEFARGPKGCLPPRLYVHTHHHSYKMLVPEWIRRLGQTALRAFLFRDITVARYLLPTFSPSSKTPGGKKAKPNPRIWGLTSPSDPLRRIGVLFSQPPSAGESNTPGCE